MPITVKSAAAEDEDAIVALWRACDLVASYNDPVIDFRFAKAGPSSDVLVAIDEAGYLVGSVMVGHDGHRGWLYYVAADPVSRSTGVGRLVVQAGEDWLRQQGIVKVQLLVRPTNTKVVGFYEHLGFEVAPTIVMSRWLRDPA
jgi:ribosomal protein S18 acetylase RimI-like enzyme